AGQGRAVLQRELDVARRLTLIAPESAPALAAARALHHLPHRRHRALLGRRQLLARHALLESRPDLRLRDAGRQLDRPAVGGRHGIPTGRRRSRIAFGRGIAPRRPATERRAVAVGRRLLRLARRRELLLYLVRIEPQ